MVDIVFSVHELGVGSRMFGFGVGQNQGGVMFEINVWKYGVAFGMLPTHAN